MECFKKSSGIQKYMDTGYLPTHIRKLSCRLFSKLAGPATGNGTPEHFIVNEPICDADFEKRRRCLLAQENPTGNDLRNFKTYSQNAALHFG